MVAWAFDVTVSAGKVTGTVNNYPLLIKLADAPSSFWTNVSLTGGDVRATVGGARVPVDVVYIDHATQTGELFVKVASISALVDTVINVYGDGVSAAEAPNTTYGSRAVWSAFVVYARYSGGTHNRVNGDAAVFTGIDPGIDTNRWQKIAASGGYPTYPLPNFGTVWVMGTRQVRASGGTNVNRSAVTIGTSGSDNYASIVFRPANTTLAFWNSFSSWTTGKTYVNGVPYIAHGQHTFDTNVRRTLWVDGDVIFENTTSNRPPLSPNTHYIVGAGSVVNNDINIDGLVQYAYITNTALSNAWVRAENDNHVNIDFYTITDGAVSLDSDTTFDYAIEAETLQSDVTFDYALSDENLPITAITTFNYRMPSVFETDTAFDFDVQNSEPSLLSQLPIMVLHATNRRIRLTQMPVLALTLNKRDNHLTQMPILPMVLKRKVVPPFDMGGMIGEALIPETPMVEIWSYLTAVSVTYNGREQRSLIRETPRQILQFNLITLDDVERYEVFNMLYEYQAKEVTYPFYQYSTPATQPIEATDTKLFFNPAFTDVREGEYLAVYDTARGLTWFAKIMTLEADGAIIDAPAGHTVDQGAYICPAIPCRFPSPGSLTLSSVTGELSLTLETTQHREFQRVPRPDLLTYFEGLPVVVTPPLVGAEDQLTQNVDWLDSAQGIPKGEARWITPLNVGKRTFKFNRFTGVEYWRSFVAHCKGRRGTFLLPTYANDLPLAETPAIGSVNIVTNNVHADAYMRMSTYRHLRIERVNGTVIYRRVVNRKLNYDLDGYPVSLSIVLNDNIGVQPGDNDIKRISFMYLARINDDMVKITHEAVDSFIELDVKAVFA